jgi:hypothetical protein
MNGWVGCGKGRRGGKGDKREERRQELVMP